MLITINLPDNTAAIKYAVADENGYILEDRPVTVGMIQNVERAPFEIDENELDRAGQ